jgi:hypothetical protein
MHNIRKVKSWLRRAFGVPTNFALKGVSTQCVEKESRLMLGTDGYPRSGLGDVRAGQLFWYLTDGTNVDSNDREQKVAAHYRGPGIVGRDGREDMIQPIYKGHSSLVVLSPNERDSTARRLAWAGLDDAIGNPT